MVPPFQWGQTPRDTCTGACIFFSVQVRFSTQHAPVHVSFNLVSCFMMFVNVHNTVTKTNIFLLYLNHFVFIIAIEIYNHWSVMFKHKFCAYILSSTSHACNINFVYETLLSYMHMCKQLLLLKSSTEDKCQQTHPMHFLCTNTDH